MSTGNRYEEVISTLLRKYFDGDLNPDERKELAGWLWESRANRELLQRIRVKHNLKKRYEGWQRIDVEQDFEALRRRIFKEKPKRRFIGSWIHYAAVAVCVLLVGVGTWIWSYSPGGQEQALVDVEKVQAILRTADGRQVRIGEDSFNEMTLGGSFVLKDSLQELVFQGNAVAGGNIRYHQLEIPRGGEYKLRLADGSTIWLNSESSVWFPESFGSLKREIRVSGEVYLEVAKDADKPFIVQAGEYRTEVLGTSFMMRVYPEDQEWSTTLVEGKVKVSYGQSALILQPGKKAFVEGDRLKEESVDVKQELAWMRGVFVFKHDRLDRVMKTLSRWYDVDFVFEREEIKDYEFTGSVRRDQKIEEVLNLLQWLNVVTFQMKDGYVLVKERDKVK